MEKSPADKGGNINGNPYGHHTPDYIPFGPHEVQIGDGFQGDGWDAVFSDDSAGYEPQWPYTRQELVPVPPFPFGRRSRDPRGERPGDEEISLEEAEQQYEEYRRQAIQNRPDIPEVNFYDQSSTAQQPHTSPEPGEKPDPGSVFHAPDA